MEFSIVKKTLPDYKYIFSGKSEDEINRFSDNPRVTINLIVYCSIVSGTLSS